MQTFYFSKDGTTRYGEKYKDQFEHIVIVLEEPENREGFVPVPTYNPDTNKAHWEYVELEPTTEEKIKHLEQRIMSQESVINFLLEV